MTPDAKTGQLSPGMSPKALLDSPNVVCKCGSRLFHEAMVIKKLSALLSPTGKDELYPIPVYVCDKCGEIPAELTSKTNADKILGLEKEEKSEEKSSSLIV